MSKKYFIDALSEETIVSLTDEMLKEERNMNRNKVQKRFNTSVLLKIIPVAALVVLVIGLINILPFFMNDNISDNMNEAGNENSTGNANTPMVIEVTSDDNRIYESMANYVFVPDDEVLGYWSAVDYINNMENFNAGKPNYSQKDLYWENVEFFDDGGAATVMGGYYNICEWTNGYMIWDNWKVVPAYEIKEIEGVKYLFVEWKSGDYTIRGENPGYYVFKPGRTPRYLKAYADVRNQNLSYYDLSDFAKNLLTLWYNQNTKFPTEPGMMPSSDKYNPNYILQAGRNPGLGVRDIHKQGITGKGVNVAIIDQPLYIDSHPEYKGKIIEYKDFNCESESSMHGPGVTSLLVGETIGTAPGAKVYYAAAPSWKGDATYYADALDWIIETNKNLPAGEKIRVVSISAAPTPSNGDMWENGEKYLESVKRAKESGILVLDCSSENGIIGACGYDFNNPEDVTLCKSGFLSNNGWYNKNFILAPIWYRTTAEEYIKGNFSYQYSGEGGLSWGIPYAAGVLAMGWEVRPELTADEIVQILRDTAYADKDGYKYINPIAFIDYLKNN